MPRPWLLIVVLLALGVEGTNVSSIALGNAHSCALLTDGTVKCWGKNFNGHHHTETQAAELQLRARVSRFAAAR